MGTAASVKTEKFEDKPEEYFVDPKQLSRRHHQTMGMVERFVSTVYNSCPSIESMWLILTNKLGQKAFHQFCRSADAEDYFKVFRDLSEILSEKELSLESWIHHFDRVKDVVLDAEGELVGRISPFLRNELSFGPRNDDGKLDADHIKSLLERTQNDIVSLMARDLFNNFIASKYYKNWRACESCHAAATTYEDASMCVTEYSTSLQSSTKSRASQSASTKVRSRLRSVVKPVNLSTSAFSSVDNRDLEAVLSLSDGWLAALIAAVEALPVAFTLATADPSRRGFPLIYVNSYFERVTGFDRSELIGKSCKDFLQCPQSEEGCIELLREGLRTASPVCTILTNQTAEGKPFKNMVALKPIVDEEKRYKYVIGIHFDVSKDIDQYRSKKSLVMDLLAAIPDNIYADDNALLSADDTSAKLAAAAATSNKPPVASRVTSPTSAKSGKGSAKGGSEKRKFFPSLSPSTKSVDSTGSSSSTSTPVV